MEENTKTPEVFAPEAQKEMDAENGWSRLASIIFYTLRLVYRATGFKEFLLSNFSHMSINLNLKQIWGFIYRVEKFQIDAIGLNKNDYSEILKILLPKVAPSDEIIDLGCGNGEGLSVVASGLPSCKIKGVDYCKKAVQLSSKKGLYASMQKIQKITSPADWFISIHTFEHFKNPYKLAKYFCVLARKGVVIQVPKPENNMSLFHVSCLDPEEMKKLGFEHIDMKSKNNNFVWLRK
ncbi:methyltransferase domain-containing protein [Candidatus Peregrinibacteria bacterium]|nr:methyltransferase domain-containing protein [Candidatus Peregrinibacteria bacterium]